MKRLWVMLPVVVGACGGEAVTAVSGTEIRLEEELRIGGLDGEIEYTFGSVTAVAPAPDGSFYVADRDGPVIRQYDANGVHLRDVGRSGQGPGEYSSVNGLGVTSAGQLVIWDSGNTRISRFDPDGAFVESSQVTGGVGTWRGFVYSLEGDAFVQTFPADFDPSTITAEFELTFDWARVLPDGELERTYPVPPDSTVGPNYVVAGRGGYYHPFGTMTLSALGPDGSFYRVRNDEYRITHIHTDGHETTIVRDEPRIPLSSDEMDEWTTRSEGAAERRPERRSDYLPIPDLKPYIREMVVDVDHRLWVSRYTETVFFQYSDYERQDRLDRELALYQWRDHLRWDVFSPDDEYLGSVTFPHKTSYVGSIGDQVWGIQAGDYNEDYVIRWRMVREVQ